jgi:hypothetical protein
MMADQELEQAISRLRATGKYEWLLNGKDMWLASDIAEQMKALGIPVTSNAITLWIKNLPSAQDFGRLGVGVSREDTIKMLADRFTSQAANG